MKRLLALIGSWLNARLRIMATDEESLYYDRADQEATRKGQ